MHQIVPFSYFLVHPYKLKCIRYDNLFHRSVSLMPSSFMVKVCTEFEKNIFRIIDSKYLVFDVPPYCLVIGIVIILGSLNTFISKVFTRKVASPVASF